MSWLVSTRQYIPAVIGEAWGGGYFAGYISHTADGNPTHALIVAPRATGATGSGYTLTTNLQWKTATTTTTGTTSTFDGAANTAAMVTAGIADHPAANFCVGLSIGGFTDWYLPAIAEIQIAYFNLKPTTSSNSTSHGSNVYYVPQRTGNWTAGYPAQTFVSIFTTSTQQFQPDILWASTQSTASNSVIVNMSNGSDAPVSKTGTWGIRAFRRIAL